MHILRSYRPNGDLKFYQTSKYFVEKPGNIIAFKISKTQNAIKVFFRGDIEFYKKLNTNFDFTISEERYSYIKLTSLNQLDDFDKIVKETRYH